jgi:hypothetical protein
MIFALCKYIRITDCVILVPSERKVQPLLEVCSKPNLFLQKGDIVGIIQTHVPKYDGEMMVTEKEIGDSCN